MGEMLLHIVIRAPEFKLGQFCNYRSRKWGGGDAVSFEFREE